MLLKIEGMSCQHCVDSVTKALSDLNGAEKVEVKLAEKTAEVIFKQGAEVPAREALEELIDDLGYELLDVQA